MKEFIGKEVKIYPGDTYDKYGKILEITDQGVLFLITRSEEKSNRGYTVGKKRFISFSARLSFEEV
jgi:succinate dehydrogenase flavin-adding protein (antitoxin of CptAB toxin-antitoxin module)